MSSIGLIWPRRCLEEPLSCFVLRLDGLNVKLFAFSFYKEVADIKLQLLASFWGGLNSVCKNVVQWVITCRSLDGVLAFSTQKSTSSLEKD